MIRVASCLALALVLALPALAAEPPVETRDGVPHVMNPATPMDGATTVALEELWRLGGDSEDEEEFFGVIGDVEPGATVSGYPARDHRSVLRQAAALARLTPLVTSIERSLQPDE